MQTAERDEALNLLPLMQQTLAFFAKYL